MLTNPENVKTHMLATKTTSDQRLGELTDPRKRFPNFSNPVFQFLLESKIKSMEMGRLGIPFPRLKLNKPDAENFL